MHQLSSHRAFLFLPTNRYHLISQFYLSLQKFVEITMRLILILFLVLLALINFSFQPPPMKASTALQDSLLVAGEKHLKNIRQLSFGGENAEAYFSADGKKLIFQSTRE